MASRRNGRIQVYDEGHGKIVNTMTPLRSDKNISEGRERMPT